MPDQIWVSLKKTSSQQQRLLPWRPRQLQAQDSVSCRVIPPCLQAACAAFSNPQTKAPLHYHWATQVPHPLAPEPRQGHRWLSLQSCVWSSFWGCGASAGFELAAQAQPPHQTQRHLRRPHQENRIPQNHLDYGQAAGHWHGVPRDVPWTQMLQPLT